MKAWLITLLLAVAVFAEETSKWGAEEKEDVVQLNKSNFDEFLKKHKFVFVKFFAPWCGHCKAMAPKYVKLAQRMKTEENGIPIAEVDATVEKELAERFKIEGFPTVKLFIDGNPVSYDGEREEEAMYSFIKKRQENPVKALTSKDEIKKLNDMKLAILVVLSQDNEEALKAATTSAYDFESISYYSIIDKDLISEFGEKGNFMVVLYRNFDDGKKIISSETAFTAGQITEFVKKHQFPLVQEFDREAAERIFGGELSAIFFFQDDDEESENFKAFKEVAKTRGQEIVFSRSKITKDLGEKLAEYIGVKEKKQTIRIIKFEDGDIKKYTFEADHYTSESISKFIDDFKENKLEAYLKSEPIPENNDKPIKTVVGKSFKDIVINSDANVMFFVYAPWCGHCKKLKPIYEELAEKLADEKDLIFTQMDGTTNEVDEVKIQGFPTLRFFKKGDKGNQVKYEGERTFDGFIKFFEKQLDRKLNVKSKDGEPEKTETEKKKEEGAASEL